MLWQLQQLLGRDGLLMLVQQLLEHIDDGKHNALLVLAQQLLGHTDEEAKQLECAVSVHVRFLPQGDEVENKMTSRTPNLPGEET